MGSFKSISIMASAAQTNNRDDFDIHLKHYDVLLKDKLITRNVVLKCYDICFSNSNEYYICELMKVYRLHPLYFEHLHYFLCTAIRKQHVEIVHQIILDGTKNGTDDSFLCKQIHKALETAIRSNNYEIVSMVLYYGGFGHVLDNGLSPLVVAIHCASDPEIQKLLLDYEDDFEPTFTIVSPLIRAILENSPLILDIINKGANLNYFDGEHNLISCSLMAGLKPDILKIIWGRFDYIVWEETFSKCALLFFLCRTFKWDVKAYYATYIEIFMENEENLHKLIQHHKESSFRLSDSLLVTLYRQGKEYNIPERTLQSYVLHMLSHGATLQAKEINELYYLSTDTSSDFFSILPYMEISYYLENQLYSPLYFNYSLCPNLYYYFDTICLDIDDIYTNQRLIQINNAIYIYAFPENIQKLIISHCENSQKLNWIKGVVRKCRSYPPSLTELARNRFRIAICMYFNIKSSCQLLTIINCMNISQHLKDILLFKQWIYR